MKKLFPFFLVLFLGSGYGVSAQTQFTFTGMVQDPAGNPVPNVQVRIEQTPAGTLTDAQGRFSLVYTKNQATLTFSSIGYETLSLKWYAADPPVRVTLVPKANELSTTRIVSERVQKLNAGVWDYTFLDEYIVLLKYIENTPRSNLVLMDHDRNEVASLNPPKRVTSLFRDCIGMVHLLTEDSAYRIDFSMGKLSLLPPVTRFDFDQGTRACVGHDPQYLYIMRKEGAINMKTFITPNNTLHYYRLDRLLQSPSLLVTIIDESIEQERQAKQKFMLRASGKGPRNAKLSADDEAALAQNNPIFKSTPTPVPGKNRSDDPRLVVSPDGQRQKDIHHDSLRNGTTLSIGSEEDILFDETILYKEVYAPLFSIYGHTSVFDFVHGRLLQYNMAGEKLSDTPIDFHKAKGWQRSMLQDTRSRRIYALFTAKDGYELREVDARSGTVKGSYAIPHTYIGNIQVHGGYIYFLYRTDMNALTTYLSRIRIM